ncbi:PREDICTED: glutamate receptor-interacting protein 2-like [Amphimedon queenslandica]|uniref:PDZ domain-containing protein n=1 Tax=Amphimedon queenslandica TaxID=400682 RepID=A0A1X7VTB0_AMPQE|nr:PREDICTED: glutamate receptor-interacting protein 2-like [Amphimedon queenslandica]|eukprot:XP_019855523.1 PREDICTED: glutamate receptor-interacting protein 2-like [Amphimedon queenslandica]
MIMAVFFSCFSAGRERRSSAGTNIDLNTSPVAHRGSSPLQAEIVCVELLKRTNEPLGLRLEGGTDYDQPVKVAQLYPGGVAYMSGALQLGDKVLSINGTVTERLTNSEVVALLENSGNIVNLEIAFETSSKGIQKIDDGMELKTAFITMSCDPSLFPGFVISGGRLENRPITVSHVKQGSYAYRKGILRAGDRILQINGVDMRGASRSEADQLLVPSVDGLCTLQIEYDIPVHDGLESNSGPLIVELQKPHGASLGITLSDERVPGEPIMISRIREAGIADRIGILHCGDRLLSINGEKLIDKSVQEAKHLLNHSDITVKLEVMLANNFTDTDGGRLPVSPADDAISRVSSRCSQSVPVENQRRPSQLSLISATSSNQVMLHPEIMTITLSADPIGFGIAIEGGTDEFSSYPVVISEIFPNGPAAILGRLLEGDRILSINDESLSDASLDHASKLIKEADDTLNMEIEFDVVDSSVVPTSGTFEVSLLKTGFLNLGLSIRKSGDKVWISDLKKGGIAYRSGSLKVGDILLTINGVSVVNGTPHEAAALLTSSGERISLSVRREATNNFMPSKQLQSKSTPVIYAVELTKNGDSLGISLDGSEQPGQPIVISKIREGGVAHRTGAIKVGDRIIAINGESLLTKTIDDACWILQNAGNTVTLKISKGVVRRRQRPKMMTSTNRYYKQQRYNNRFKSNSRIPSRISHSSESELSASFTSLEGSVPYLVHSRHPHEKRQQQLPFMNGAVPGRYSPSRGPRGSGRGRLSPTKERTSPNRERNGGSKAGGVGLKNGGVDGFHRLSITETTDEETQEEPPLLWEGEQANGGIRKPGASRNGAYSNKSPHSPLVESTSSWRNNLKIVPSSSEISETHDSSVSHAPPPAPSSEQHPVHDGFEEKMMETIYRSQGFTRKLRHLAQSGSSAEESDQEMSGLFLHPHYPFSLHPPPSHPEPGEELIEVTVVKEKDFGFSFSDGLSEPGVYINQINPEGPAAHSGLQSYDRIIEFNGSHVADYDCFKLRPLFSGTDTIVLTVLRKSLSSGVGNGAAAKSINLPTTSNGPSLPVYLSSLTDDEGQ